LLTIEDRHLSTSRLRPAKRHLLIALAIVFVYLSLAFLCIQTAVPWNDEAWYTSPSLSLITHGNTGTPILETAGKFWQGINQRTYWVMPLYLFVQVPWFDLFGFSLTSARLFAVGWGLVAMLCWGAIVYRLTSNAVMSLLTLALIACDYQFVTQTSLARMDAMAVATAALGILLYVVLRERHLTWAIALSQCGVVASGLTHPSIGVPAFCAVVFLTLYLDFRRIRLSHVLVAIIPYVLGAAFWWWYISPAPSMFRAQFFGNVVDIDRLGGFTHPLKAIAGEVGRYLTMAGFNEGHSALTKIKAIPVLIRLGAVVALLSLPATRKQPGIRALLWLLAVYLLCMTFYENTKEVKYAINTIGIYCSLTAVCLAYLWQRRGIAHVASGFATLSLIAIGILGLLYVGLVKDDYRREFLPAADFLKHSAQPSDLILASSEFGFPLGFGRNIVDDSSFTYNSHKTPKFIVMGPGYQADLQADTDLAVFVSRLLSEHYKLVFSNSEYLIYQYRGG